MCKYVYNNIDEIMNDLQWDGSTLVSDFLIESIGRIFDIRGFDRGVLIACGFFSWCGNDLEGYSKNVLKSDLLDYINSALI